MSTQPLTPRIEREMTLEEWADLPEDEMGELVDGRLEEEEMPSFVHELVVTWLAQVLRTWLAGKGFVGGSGVKLAVAPRRGRMADLLVYLPGSKKPPPRGIVSVPPDIAVEIVTATPRDARRDRIEKLDEYAAFGIRFYWIVDPELRSLEILELGADGRYVHALGATEEPARSIPGCAGLVLDVPGLWAEIARLEAEEDKG